VSSANLLKYQDVPRYLEIDTNRVPLIVRRNSRSKRIYLRYNPTDHIFSLTLPQRARIADGVDFIRIKSDWIAETLQQMPSKKLLKPGVVIPVLGEKIRLRHDPEMRSLFTLKDGQLTISGPREQWDKRVEDALKKIVRNEITGLAEVKAAAAGRRVKRITLRDTRSRWGSCSSDSNLMFSWRLVFAPYEVLDYVVAHEIAHLRHMNHRPVFWDVVSQLCPNYLEWKDWLQIHGKELYRFVM
jgi:predicted metal-dependent hydrolase